MNAARVEELMEVLYQEDPREERDAYATLDRLRAVYISMNDDERKEFERVLGGWANGSDEGKRYDALALIDEFKIGESDGTERPDLLLLGIGDYHRLSSASVHFIAKFLFRVDASDVARADHSEEELGAAGNALINAGVIELAKGRGTELDAELSAIFGCVFEGGVVMSVEHERSGKTYLRKYYLGNDDLAVEHIPQGNDQHDFYLFDSEDLFKRIVMFTGLAEERPVSTKPRFTTELRQLLEVVRGSDNGLPVPEHFRAVLPNKISSTRFRAVIRTDTGIKGGEVLWVDLGDEGLWAIDATPDGAADVHPVSTEHIIERFAQAVDLRLVSEAG